jgi:chemosensory pili system protein ChpA (sensor histidine kinase/response regulator)
MPEDLIKQINAALESEEEQEYPPIKSSGIENQKTIERSKHRKLEKLLEKEADVADSAEDRIRVKATLIDKLTNLAGELSISRAHVEQQQGTLKNHLVEMDETVIRLRDQLRRFEIETEAQIISHFSEGIEGDEFDLLELDRFSVMQQLSRSLMESVSDLTSIQDSLKNVTRQSDSLLIQQSRIGAELQDGIMRTRMVPFTKISPRLQRIARLTARELHKKVDFIIKGEDIEFERTVLNRIVAPLEHMLRNAIDHGVEEAKTRQEAGKSGEAKITIALSREGAELIIKLSDDGAGLNLSKIRQKAEKRGLIKPETVINDQELMQFVLEHGFSTAEKVTPTSGRGVGMDVAYSEIKQLGGSLQIHSKINEGTTFDIRLPLSLTITQALLVHIGEETMAVPMNHIDAVMRVPRAEVIGKADEVDYYKYMDNNYRIFNLGKLLGFAQMNSDEVPLIPMLLAHIADRRVALLVDGIEGSKEIVVKSVGTQMGAIRWLAGATILGDGRVVLILDMPSITRVDITAVTAQPPIIETIEEEKTVAKTIMIVDDSITVRKVTARFLKRQGMDVLTAKDGLDAIAQLQEHTPDLMLLDIEMPRMDGYELATQLRNRSDFKDLPIIMITSRTGTKHRDKAKKMGINHYLGKPFNEAELLENIHALLN